VVSRENLHEAIAMNSAGFNVARAIGPALGGLVIAAMGSGFAFLLNAASFFGVILFLYQWKRTPHEQPHPRERMLVAIQTGLKYLRTSAAMRAVLVRTGAFSVSAIAMLAMLPLIARPYGSVGFGVLLGCFGAGALMGAAALPIVRRMLSIDALVGWSTVVFAATTAALGRADTYAGLVIIMIIAGGAWINILASLNVSAQTTAPAWLRARAISMYLLILQGGMAAGSTLWGAVAQRYGIAESLLFAAIVLIVGLIAVPKYRLQTREVPFQPAPVSSNQL
jgi:predicted MFS family arabinose efflux permease